MRMKTGSHLGRVSVSCCPDLVACLWDIWGGDHPDSGNWVEKTSSLWVAPFPRDEILNCMSGESQLSTNTHV